MLKIKNDVRIDDLDLFTSYGLEYGKKNLEKVYSIKNI